MSASGCQRPPARWRARRPRGKSAGRAPRPAGRVARIGAIVDARRWRRRRRRSNRPAIRSGRLDQPRVQRRDDRHQGQQGTARQADLAAEPPSRRDGRRPPTLPRCAGTVALGARLIGWLLTSGTSIRTRASAEPRRSDRIAGIVESSIGLTHGSTPRTLADTGRISRSRIPAVGRRLRRSESSTTSGGSTESICFIVWKARQT